MSSSVEPLKRPRSGTQSSSSIRGKLNDRLTKLQTKHAAEVELLEDLKQFSRQRSVLEKQYSENLHRLVSQFTSKREISAPPSLPGFERHENRGLMEVWNALLNKTEELSKRRLTMSELLLTQVSEVAKQQKKIKEANFKRLIEVSQRVNTELLESTKELSSSKKSYGESAKLSEEARAKYSEVETRLKKRDVKFFESVSSLEKQHNKAADKLKLCQRRTTAGRNDYLLAIATTNAHLKRHCSNDFPKIMQAMDGEMYAKVRDAYSFYAQIEADAANFVKAEFEDLAEQAYLVNREYVLECYLHRHPVLRDLKEFSFEPYTQDTVTAISRDHGAEIYLDKDARKWANLLTKDIMSITSLQKQVKGLQSVTSAYAKNPEFGTSESQAEALLKTDLLLEEIRQLEVQTTKAGARLDMLRQAGIDVNKWLQKAEKSHGQHDKNVVSASELTPAAPHGRVSQLSLPASIGGSQDFDVETASVGSTQLGGDDSVSLGSGKSDPQHRYCTALYSYTAQRDDELSITENQELEVVEWDDGDGWCKGRSQSGREGYFPQSYVKPVSRPPSPIQNSSNPVTALTFEVGTPVLTHKTNGPAKPKVMLRALYEYSAQFAEELSFPEGALLELLRTDENGVDDGWWEGCYQGKVGVFPSLVVEICKDEQSSPDLNATIQADSLPPPLESPPPLPPDYSPPPIDDFSSSGGVGPAATVIPDHAPMDPLSTPVNSITFSPTNARGGWDADSFDSDDCSMV